MKNDLNIKSSLNYLLGKRDIFSAYEWDYRWIYATNSQTARNIVISLGFPITPARTFVRVNRKQLEEWIRILEMMK